MQCPAQNLLHVDESGCTCRAVWGRGVIKISPQDYPSWLTTNTREQEERCTRIERQRLKYGIGGTVLCLIGSLLSWIGLSTLAQGDLDPLIEHCQAPSTPPPEALAPRSGAF